MATLPSRLEAMPWHTAVLLSMKCHEGGAVVVWMARMPVLIDRVGKAAREDLAALGFRKRSGQIYTLNLAADVIGSLGLGSATKYQSRGVVEVWPKIGIRHQSVERILAELEGYRFHPYAPPTIGANLGYLMPANRWTTWTVDTADSTAAVRDLARAVRDHGMPFMRRNGNLKAIIAPMDANRSFEQHMVYRRPIAWLLAGDRARARSWLRDEVIRLGDRIDLPAQQFRRFAAALLEKRLAT
jgi:hypothetical protein